MKEIQLFPKDQVVGIFRGFQQGGMEFHADLVLPYRNEFQNIPMHGQFLLVQLETSDEAVLGRIASFSSEGKLSFGSGEEFNIRAVREGRPIPEDLREQYLKYRVNIRVLGVLRRNGKGLTFVPSHRRLPHVGSKVALPNEDGRFQVSSATVDVKAWISSAMASAGVLQPRVFLGRLFISAATSFSQVWLAPLRSAPLGMN
jgi:hypothetical protein